VGGLLSLAASGIALTWTRETAFQRGFIGLWLLVLLLTAGTNTLFIVMGSRRRGEPVFSVSMKAALAALAPAFIAGGAFTFCLAAGGWGEAPFMVSAIWGIFYGLGLLATGHFAPRSLMLLGWAFFASGIAALIFCFLLSLSAGGMPGMPEEPDRLAALFMAATFGLFHLLYAACAWPRKQAVTEP
jgi:hypothetical protein